MPPWVLSTIVEPLFAPSVDFLFSAYRSLRPNQFSRPARVRHSLVIESCGPCSFRARRGCLVLWSSTAAPDTDFTPGAEAGFDPDAGFDLDNAFGPDTAADELAADEWTGG